MATGATKHWPDRTPGCDDGAMPAYLIVNYDVVDADAYKQYQKGAGPALGIGADCKVLVLDHASQIVEGDSVGQQTVVLEFESREKAQAVYDSDDYQAVLPTRLGATTKHFAVIVDGFSMPS